MGMGMRELDRAQLRRESTRVVKKPCPLLAFDPAMREVQAVGKQSDPDEKPEGAGLPLLSAPR